VVLHVAEAPQGRHNEEDLLDAIHRAVMSVFTVEEQVTGYVTVTRSNVTKVCNVCILVKLPRS
jgi:hypothetical protein